MQILGTTINTNPMKTYLKQILTVVNMKRKTKQEI